MTGTDALSEYQQAVNNLVKTFGEKSLELHITKTKELCCGDRNKGATTSPLSQPLSIQGQLVERVHSFKYLGNETDTRLSFTQHAHLIYEKVQQRLHLPRKLGTFNISEDRLTPAQQSLIKSILTFNISSWCHSLTIKHKTKLCHVTNQASKIIGSPQTTKQYNRCEQEDNPDHRRPVSPLHHSFQRLLTDRKYKVPLT